MLPVQTSRGIVYVATGDPYYLLLAAGSIISLRDTGYQGPITLFTDLSAQRLRRLGVDIVRVSVPRARKPSRAVKTLLGELTPYRETLFLDADIVAQKPFSLLWNSLAKHDIALARDRNPTLVMVNHATPAELKHTLKRLPASAPHYNSGVIVWKQSAKTRALFKSWHQEWKKFGDIDQLALSRAIAATGIAPREITTTAFAHLAERKKHALSAHPRLYARARSALGVSALRALFWRHRHAFKRFARRVLGKT